ncbi:MAG TPA: YraN family protein [bacterium]|nr:YraN family protein [bacterium]
MKSDNSVNYSEKNKILGTFGEHLTENHYKSQGYKILTKNFKHHGGEIDLIAQKNDIIVFIEVKTRENFEDIHPSEVVDKIKRLKIIKTAKYFNFLNNYNEKDYYFRFDIANIFIYNYPEKYKIEIFENCFDEKGKIL